MYADGVSESYIGTAIAGRRDRFFVASKVGMPRSDTPSDAGLSRAHITAGIDGTLRRLQIDYLDLYYAHRPDPSTPIEETVPRVRRSGQAGEGPICGLLEFLRRSDRGSSRRGRIAGLCRLRGPVSRRTTLFERSLEAEIAPCCARHGMGIVAYTPLAQGVLTGKYRPGEPIPPGTRAWQNPSRNLARYLRDDRLETVRRLDDWARDHGHRVGELAIAWLLAKPLVCSVLTAVTSHAQLEANIRAADWELTPEYVQAVQDLVAT